MSVRRNLGYSMREAEQIFFDSCDGTNVMHLIEVFERDGINVERRRRDLEEAPIDVGELWLCDEDGFGYIVGQGWDYEMRETVGFDRAELIDMKERGEL